jgi:phosphatidylinositol-3-phosphatase
MNVFPSPMDSVKALSSRKSGWLQARTDLPGRRRAGAARRSRASAASGFAGVVLLALASCSGSGPAAGGPPGQAGSASATPASTGRPAAGSTSPPATGAQPSAVPEPAHTVVVVMENHSYAEIIGNPAAPFINTLAGRGALFTRSYAITHPSQPNYLALFSGGTQGVTDDSCPHQFTAPNLAADLSTAGKSFAGYAEDLPGPGSPVCSAGEYARKHAPWTDFSNVPGPDSLPLTSFPADFARLPAVSFVIPDLCHDMHDCSIAAGDGWLRAQIGGYAGWAMRHHSLLIVTWDEDDGSQGNHIVTIFAGQQVRPGRYAEPVTHYSVLATIEAAYALPRDGQAATAMPITSIWGP